jgi:hypothetical protein
MSTDTPPYDPTVTWVRHCTSCGSMDDRERWASKAEAVDDRVFQRAWACPSCAGNGFEVKPVARLGGG